MGMEMYDKICRMVEADIEELISKGSLDPQDYPCLGEAIDIVKDVKKIKMMKMEEEEMMMPEEDMMRSYGSGRMPRYNMRMSNARGGSRDGSYGSYAMGYPVDNGEYNTSMNGSNAYEQGGSNGSYARGGGQGGGSNAQGGGSNYNPNRSPITGRYTSRESSYHDMDGSMKQDLEELLGKAKDDHERMLIMRVLSKIEQ